MRVAIVFHSQYGHTERQARAVALGVEDVQGVGALLMSVDEAEKSWAELDTVEAIIFGAPTYVGSLSARFKSFAEASSRAVMARAAWRDKLAAGFTNSGCQAGDKMMALMQLTVFAAQHGMHWVNLDLPPANNSTAGTDAELNRLGFWLGAAAQSNVDQAPDLTPPEADLATARHLGRRVALTALGLRPAR